MESCQALEEHDSRVSEIVRQRVRRFGRFEPSAPVIRSWTRCVDDHGLRPDAWRAPPVLTSAELAARRGPLADLIGCAKLEMATLYQQLGDAELAVVLTDADGVILHLVSSTEFAEEVEDWGFCVGAVWERARSGHQRHGHLPRGRRGSRRPP
ncbi:hypothetical protein B0G84_7458, partial [Paraburkholderia sp. BL8N3]